MADLLDLNRSEEASAAFEAVAAECDELALDAEAAI